MHVIKDDLDHRHSSNCPCEPTPDEIKGFAADHVVWRHHHRPDVLPRKQPEGGR